MLSCDAAAATAVPKVQISQLTMHVSNLLNLKNTAVSVTWLVFSVLRAIPTNLPRLLIRLIFSPLTCDLRNFPSSGDQFERRIVISWTMDFLMISGGSTSTALASNVRFANENFFTMLRPTRLRELLLLDLRLTTLRSCQATVDHVRFMGTYVTRGTSVQSQRDRTWNADHECTTKTLCNNRWSAKKKNIRQEHHDALKDISCHSCVHSRAFPHTHIDLFKPDITQSSKIAVCHRGTNSSDEAK